MANVLWLTGIPSSGKTTLCKALCTHLSLPTLILDGDTLRAGLSNDLSFSAQARSEQGRRAATVAVLAADQGILPIIALVSPMRAGRKRAQTIIEDAGHTFLEVFVDADKAVCYARDVKGLYAKARAKEITGLTGWDAGYDTPLNPALRLDTALTDVANCVTKLLTLLGLPSSQKPHISFIGRWAPFHKGHFAIIEETRKQHPDAPVYVMVRDTAFDKWPAHVRADMVRAGFAAMNIPATVSVVPDVKGLYWGRKVGYEVECVDVDVPASGTDIRASMEVGDDMWEAEMCPGVAEFMKTNGLV